MDVVLPGSSGVYGKDAAILKTLDRSMVKAVMFKPLNVPALVTFIKGLG